MKKVLIVQSNHDLNIALQFFLMEDLSGLFENIISSDSFNHALTIVPRNEPFVALVGDVYNDLQSNFGINFEEKIPDTEKNANKLAEMIKEINPEATVVYWSEEPIELKNTEFLDGGILTNNFNEVASLLIIFLT
jgi:hypothetical protein